MGSCKFGCLWLQRCEVAYKKLVWLLDSYEELFRSIALHNIGCAAGIQRNFRRTNSPELFVFNFNVIAIDRQDIASEVGIEASSDHQDALASSATLSAGFSLRVSKKPLVKAMLETRSWSPTLFAVPNSGSSDCCGHVPT